MKKTLIAFAVLAASTSCFATYCPDGSTIESHPGGDCSKTNKPPKNHGQPKTPAAPVAIAGAAAGAAADAEAIGIKGNVSPIATGVKGDIVTSSAGGAGGDARQGQRQGQGQQQGQQLRSTNAAQSTGGAVTIQGDQAGSGDVYKSTFTAWAPVALGAGAAAVPTATMGPIVIPCGPRQYLYDEDVIGHIVGPFGGLTEVKLGTRTRSIPMTSIGEESYLIEDVYETVALPNGYHVRNLVGQVRKGHIIAGYATTLTTSSARSFSLGLYHEGSGGQGGAAGSAGMQQQAKDLEAFECDKDVRWVKVQAPPPPPAPKVVYRTRWRDRPVAPPATPCCVPPPVCCSATRRIY